MDDRLPFGLCAFGLSYTCGFAGRGTPRENPAPLSLAGLVELAAELRLRWVEIPPTGVPAEHRPALRERAAQLGLELVAGGRRVEARQLEEDLLAAVELGAKVVRTTLSGILCGDRRKIGLAGWQRIVGEAAETLGALAPLAEEHGLQIGVENHQDATSADLLRLCEAVDSPAVGITLDTGNPLAVCEEPLEFAARVLPHLVDVHLKDYRIFPTRSGFRLSHCPIGSGVVDFAALFELLDGRPDLPRSIELAALGERHVTCLEPSWWDGYPPREARSFASFLHFVRGHESEGEWRTPFELGQPRLREWEFECLMTSLDNLSRIAMGESW